MSSAEENKALARRFLEAQDEADVEALDELLAPDFVDHTLLPGQVPGREGYIRMIVEDIDALSDVRTTIDYQAVDGDTVITRQTSYSTHDRGELRGLLPTGRERETTGIVIHRISGGKIVEEWSTNSVGSFVEDLVQEMRQREHIERELQVAQTIQQASLPREVPQLEGWRITPIYLPAREVGGDFYDFLELDDGRLGLVVGDATGHGVPAALVMASARSMLRAVAQVSNSPGDALRRVNDPLATEIPPNMFVTCFYCILDPKSGRLSYANAGHDVPYVWHGGACEELMARGMPLGLLPGMHYEQKEIVLQKGESALLYTDGLVEAHNPQREMFGFPRLQTLVSEHAEEERSLEATLLEELYSFVGEGWEQEDDITLLTLRRSAAPS
jgi:serine phosphatase RsbU (regulator of sigma subunit)/ketosteroid isomerase-like protein